MQSASKPITQDLVLIGGGHSHAIALKKFGMNPVPGVRLTLITDVFHTPYSGMLPGYVAGLYQFDDCHIDLRPLSQFAQAQMIVDRAVGLDLVNQRVLCANRPAIPFDLLSIDIGSIPTVSPVPGALQYAIPVKPISQFLAHWEQVVEQVRQVPQRSLRISIVGGGVGGVELTLAVQAHLQRIYRGAQQPSTNLEIHLFHRSTRLLPSHTVGVSRRVEEVLVRRGVYIHLEETVSQVQPNKVECESGFAVKCDRIFWVTQASTAPWLRESGLAVDANGFVQVNDLLRSTSHPQVFAAGDVATMVNHPRPKAGVFAVRQGKPLFRNLRNTLLKKPLQSFTPQKKYLILVGTGEGEAIASRDPFSLGPHALLWRWKDSIDRKFMRQFSHLKAMSDSGKQERENSSQPLTSDSPEMRCAGCGSKVSRSVLERTLKRIKQEQSDKSDGTDILIGLDAPDDAAVIQVPTGLVLVQTVDYFRALVNDPFLFGQISTHHCLSDIFAMGALPRSGLAIATLPYGPEPKVEETLYQLLSGATKALRQAQAVLIGGHTTEGAELSFGLSCNGLAYADRLLRKSGMKPGQVLILTKALGTGALFAADMRLQAKGRWIEAAVQSMLLSNQDAAACFQRHQATACTDVTGFGLLGHLLEMIRASQVCIELDLESIPTLDGAIATAQRGIVSSLYPQNLEASAQIENLERVSDRPPFSLLFDPQTSGGLLASVAEEQAIACLSALKEAGYSYSSIIGRVLPQREHVKPVTILT